MWIAVAQGIIATEDALIVDLTDGRTISVPLAWYPRLLHGTPEERNKWRLIGNGEGIHWPDLDEDISIEGLVLGKPSGESQRSFKQWLEQHQQVLEEKAHPKTPARRPRRLSEDFYAALMAGELARYDAYDETRADFSRWKGIYETWLRRKEA
jgi:hypothetical protein